MTRLGLALLVWLALPAIAFAHPEVERARQLVLDGDYDAARPALDAALARADLSRDDLVALLEVRALLFYGLAEHEELDRALRSLASLAPTHHFGPRFPPDLAQRSVAIGRDMTGGLRVVTRQVPSAVGLRLEARVQNDSEGLVRELRYRVFDAASGQWSAATPPLEAAAGRELLVLVEAVGPGGAVVAGAGSSDAPIRLRGPATSAVSAQPSPLEASLTATTETPAEGRGLPDWVPVVMGIGAALVVGAIVGGSIYAAENPTIIWQPSMPTEVDP